MDHPYIYLLEFHIGDGYFDRQSIGKYSLVVHYRNESNILINENERGDDRLVKFRQGKSIIFGMTDPDDEMQILFSAFDNNERIGESNIYFTGIGGPKMLATKSINSPTASVIRTNLQLSRSAGSLQVFIRLTCFGDNLLTEFSVSNNINTEFDLSVSDIELTAEESFTRCHFDFGNVKEYKGYESEKEENNDNEINNVLNEEIKQIKLTDNNIENDTIYSDPSLCFYEASVILQDESDEILKQTVENVNQHENVKATLADLIEKTIDAIDNSNNNKYINESREIHNLDDLMFTNFLPPDERISQEDSESLSSLEKLGNCLLSADNSIIDLKFYENICKSDNEELKEDELCIEPKIGDTLSKTNTIEEIKDDIENEIINERKDEEISHETGDAPTGGSGTEESKTEETELMNKQGQKRRKQNQMPYIKQDIINEEEEEMYKEDGGNSQTSVTCDNKNRNEKGRKNNNNQSPKRKYARGKRRGNSNK